VVDLFVSLVRDPSVFSHFESCGLHSTAEARSSPFRKRHLLLLVVVERLPETDPDVEQAESAADAAEEAV